jgi:hypothetical protein
MEYKQGVTLLIDKLHTIEYKSMTSLSCWPFHL